MAATLLLAAAGCDDSRAPAMTGPAGTGRAEAGPAANGSPQAAAASASVDDPSSSAGRTSDVSTSAAAGERPGEAGSPEPDAKVSASRPERTRDISFDDLKFDIKKEDPFERSLLTEKIESLEGKPIRIRGYILPSFQQSGLTQFVLVRDNQSCCFGPGGALYDCIIVEMKPGKSTDYSLYPVAVEGDFSIREMLDPDGKTVAIYHLDGEGVR